MGVGQYNLPTGLQLGDGDKVRDTFLVEPHLEVTVCPLHFGDHGAGVTSASHCGVNLLDVCQKLFREEGMIRRAAI